MGVFEFRGYVDSVLGFTFRLKIESISLETDMPFLVYACSKCGVIRFIENKSAMKQLESRRADAFYSSRTDSKETFHLT